LLSCKRSDISTEQVDGVHGLVVGQRPWAHLHGHALRYALERPAVKRVMEIILQGDFG
jgi:hypothetical protein